MEEAQIDQPAADAARAEAPLLLIDGNSLAFRAFFALPDSIATADGRPTNALYGLASMLVKIFSEWTFSAGICCWDAAGPVFRHERFPEYKAGRAATPDLFREQRPHFQPLMEVFGLVNTELSGYEADDVIGTLATRAEAAGREVVIVTGDRDALQLVSERVSVLATGRGVTDTVLYTPEAVRERYGVGPEQMTDFRGLVGDSSDNLPGVPGIGEKGAAGLIQKYGSLDAVLAAADDQTPKRRENLIAHADDARLSRELAEIVRDAPVAVGIDEPAPLVFGQERVAAVAESFRELEFDSLLRRLGDLGAPVPEAPAPEPVAVAAQRVASQELGLRLAGVAPCAVALGAEHWAIAPPEGDVLWGGSESDGPGEVRAALAGGALIVHDGKGQGIADANVAHDTMIGAYLLQPRRRGYDLVELCEQEGIAVGVTEPPEIARAAATAELARRQASQIEQRGLERLFREVELPVAAVLADMERVGIKLDVPLLGEISARIGDRIDELRDRIHELAGEAFTIESPKQLGHVLFEVLGLPTYRKGKTGYSTDRRVLSKLEGAHPIIALIGQYRELTKLESTYLSALPAQVDGDERLHTTFAQTVAETGRLSSREPNLQNIPVRTPLGREIRAAFVAEPGHVLISCDYGQVELRVLAHCSGEPALRRAFAEGVDIHLATAAEVFDLPIEQVDRDLRDRAKAVNFGIIYGISDFGLSEQLGIPREDAKRYIATYLDRYPRVQEFIDRTIADALRDGQVATLLGRIRPIPELTGRTVQQRQLGERLAVNTVIQGTAADIIKVAMVRSQEALAGSEARLVLQIHDELLVESPVADAEAAATAVREAMVGAYDLDPPLAVDVGVGESWRDAKA